MSPWRLAALSTAGLAVLVAGCGGGGGGGPANHPPAITEASVTPRELRFTGGTVTIAARVTDDHGVSQVAASISGPGGISTVVLAASGAGYEGTYTATPNGSSTDRTYSISITAVDASDLASGPVSLTFTVRSPASPPGKPGL